MSPQTIASNDRPETQVEPLDIADQDLIKPLPRRRGRLIQLDADDPALLAGLSASPSRPAPQPMSSTPRAVSGTKARTSGRA